MTNRGDYKVRVCLLMTFWDNLGLNLAWFRHDLVIILGMILGTVLGMIWARFRLDLGMMLGMI